MKDSHFKALTDSKHDATFASMTCTENRTAVIWSEVLQCAEPIRPDSNFFALGGDSLGMMMLLFRVGEEYQLETFPEMLLEAPTLREFCVLLDARRATETTPGELASNPDQQDEGSF